MCDIDLTEYEWAVVELSLLKHLTLIRTGALPELLNFSSDDFDCLISKVDKLQKVAWLKEQREKH